MNTFLKHKVLNLTLISLIAIIPLISEAANLHPVKRGEKYGYANEEGKMVIFARFAIAMDFGEGLAYVAESPDRQGSWKHGFIDESGKWVAFLDGKSFRPSLQKTGDGKTIPQIEGYGDLHDCVVFANGFAELPSYNSTGGQDFETSSVWINRHQMKEMTDRFGKNILGKSTPISPTSRIFFSKLLRGDRHIIGVYAKARNTKGPNGVIAFDDRNHKPVTTIQAGEDNEWFGTFGVMRYLGNTYCVYSEGNKQVKYFDDVKVLQPRRGGLELLAKGLDSTYVLYSSSDIRPLNDYTYTSVGEFMQKHQGYYIVETEDYISELPELQSRKMMNFSSIAELEEYYLSGNGRFDTGKTPKCETIWDDTKAEVRIVSRCGAVLITDYNSRFNEAWLWDFTSTRRMKVSFPLKIDASGTKGEDGEKGTDGAHGRPKRQYQDGKSTKTDPGTCGEAGGNGKNGRNGEDGAILLIIMDSNIPEDSLTVNVEGGAGGKGGAAGIGGNHGLGSPCKGKANNGKPGKDGCHGKSGVVKIVKR